MRLTAAVESCRVITTQRARAGTQKSQIDRNRPWRERSSNRRRDRAPGRAVDRDRDANDPSARKPRDAKGSGLIPPSITGSFPPRCQGKHQPRFGSGPLHCADPQGLLALGLLRRALRAMPLVCPARFPNRQGRDASTLRRASHPWSVSCAPDRLPADEVQRRVQLNRSRPPE